MTKKLNKDYWENRYQEQEIGWDVGFISTPLKEYIDQLKDNSLKILIPGAGNGYEFDYLYEKGFTNVFVIDIAPTPLQNMQQRLPHLDAKHFINQDFFSSEDQFDLIIEQTFFCALSPTLRKAYVEKMFSLLRPKGKIVGLLFDFPLTGEGPPFGGSRSEYQTLFEDYFEIKVLETANNSIKPRAGKELFVQFVKK
jgi:SAM-dependent methyltransferase